MKGRAVRGGGHREFPNGMRARRAKYPPDDPFLEHRFGHLSDVDIRALHSPLGKREPQEMNAFNDPKFIFLVIVVGLPFVALLSEIGDALKTSVGL